MNEEEFKKLKVGDKVRIVGKEIYEWDDFEKAQNIPVVVSKIYRKSSYVEVKNICDDCFSYELDYGFCSKDLELVSITITEHIVKDNKVIIKLSNGKVGVARCNPEDKFDIATGTMIALKRAYGIEEEKQENKQEELKFGDRVRFKTLKELDKEFLKSIESINGKRISLTDFTVVDNVNWHYTKEMFVKVSEQTLEERVARLEKLIGGNK